MGKDEHFRKLYVDGFGLGYQLAKAYVIGTPPKKAINQIYKQGASVYHQALRDGIEQRATEYRKACVNGPFLNYIDDLKKGMHKTNDHEIDI